MNIIHIVSTPTYQVVVVEQDETYLVRYDNQVSGQSVELDRSENKVYAISSAEKFPGLYSLAQKSGFALSGDEFVNKHGKSISVNESFDIDRSLSEFERLLNSLNKSSE